MNILFLSHYFSPEGNAPALRTHGHCRHWVRKGHKVTVITCAPNVPTGILYDGYRNKWRQVETIDGIRVIRVWTYLAPNKGALLRVVNYVSFMINASLCALFLPKPDVLIATSPQFFCGWAGAIVSKLRRIPFILEIRDLWPEAIKTVGGITNRRIIGFLERLEAILYRMATHIVTVGEGYKAHLLQKGVSDQKLSIMTNGVDCQEFSPSEPDDAIRKRWNANGAFVCLYAGTVGMACGLDIIIRAARLLEKEKRLDIKFVVVGDGAVRAELGQIVDNEKIDNVLIAGLRDHETIPSIIASADACFVHLKKKDLFTTVVPTKIFEAAAMAKPVILGVEGHAKELVDQAGCGLPIEPENEHQLVTVTTRLADNKELARKLGESGRKHVVNHYDRTQIAEDYLSLLERVLDHHQRLGGGKKPKP